MTTTSSAVLQTRAERIKELNDTLAEELALIEASTDKTTTKAASKNLVSVLFKNAIKAVKEGDESRVWVNPLREARARLA